MYYSYGLNEINTTSHDDLKIFSLFILKYQAVWTWGSFLVSINTTAKQKLASKNCLVLQLQHCSERENIWVNRKDALCWLVKKYFLLCDLLFLLYAATVLPLRKNEMQILVELHCFQMFGKKTLCHTSGDGC